MSSAVDMKTNSRIEKRKLHIAMQVLQEASFTFPETKHFIDKKLKQKCANENISVEEVIYFLLFCLYIDSGSLSLTVKIVVLSFFLIYGLLCNKEESCKATSLEAKKLA